MPMRSNGHDRPVVAVDIDGTLAEYHQWFLRFAAQYLGRDDLPAPEEINPGKPLYRHMGITKAQYREAKLAYRQGGLKRSMPCLPGAAGLIDQIRGIYCLRSDCDRHTGLGAEVWICTTRPYLRLDNVDPDTREWLRRNGIKYDALLFDPIGGDNKYRELMRQAGRRVACALEDLPEQAARAAAAGVPYTFLRDQPYNQHWQGNPRWQTADSAFGMIQAALDEWRFNGRAT